MALQAQDDGRVPISVRIGITGHRDLADPASAEALVDERLRAIRAAFAFPDTIVRFIVLSAVAEGADRLVVHRAFSVFEDATTLHAVLPTDDYRSDFASEGSKQEFDALLERAASSHLIPHTNDRDEAYERAGHYIVDQSDVVIALWNGNPDGHRGGTSQVVKYAEDHHVPVLVTPAARVSERDRGAGPTPKSPRRQLEQIARSAPFMRIAQLNERSIRHPPLALMADNEWNRLAKAAQGSSLVDASGSSDC